MFKESYRDEFEKYLEVEDHILKQLQILDVIGRGTFGFVWKVQDKRTSE